MLSEGALDSIGGADPCDRQFCKSADSSWGQVASLGTVLHRLTGATTVAAVGLDLAALACTVATEGACAPLAYSALAANVTDAAVTNHFGTSSANFRRFGISVGMSIASAYGDVGLENFAKYLEKSGAGGGRVVRGIYGGIKVVLGRLVAP